MDILTLLNYKFLFYNIYILREQVKERALEKDLFYPNSDYMDRQDDTVFNEGRRIQFVKVIGEICNSIDVLPIFFKNEINTYDGLQ